MAGARIRWSDVDGTGPVVRRPDDDALTRAVLWTGRLLPLLAVAAVAVCRTLQSVAQIDLETATEPLSFLPVATYAVVVVGSFVLPFLVVPLAALDTVERDGAVVSGLTLLGRRSVVLTARPLWRAHLYLRGVHLNVHLVRDHVGGALVLTDHGGRDDTRIALDELKDARLRPDPAPAWLVSLRGLGLGATYLGCFAASFVLLLWAGGLL